MHWNLINQIYNGNNFNQELAEEVIKEQNRLSKTKLMKNKNYPIHEHYQYAERQNVNVSKLQNTKH